MTNLFNRRSIVSDSLAFGSSRIKRYMATAVLGGGLIASGLAQADQTTIPVDLTGANATKHEIALLQVLSEVCPPMLSDKQRVNFFKAYNYELEQLLPTISDPKAAIHYLSTQQDYKEILSSMRSWTLGYSRNDNLALCTDLANETL